MQIASISSVLYPLAVLGCPVGMGAMMWMMRKGPRRGHSEDRHLSDRQPASVELLREEHRRLGEEIARLEGPQGANAGQHR